MAYYPARHHPIYFLQDALIALGIRAEYNERDERTEGCYGLIIEDKPFAWLIDNRWPWERVHEDPAAVRLMERGALVCCAQKPDAERIGAKWLPLAASPGYRPPDKPRQKLYDVGFVGYIHDEARLHILKELSRHFTVANASGVFGDAAVSIYWDSKVAVNIPTRYGDPAARDSANMRCFEALATGTPLVTPYEEYLSELGLIDGLNCITYRNVGMLIECLPFIDAAAQNIGAYGVALAQKRHTYRHRAEQVMEWLK